MRRLAVILVVFALILEYIIMGAMSMRVSRLEDDLASARAAQAPHVLPAETHPYPLTVGTRTPAVTFSDQQALADYVVRVHDDLASLRTAMEADIHQQQDTGTTQWTRTHTVIDGPRLAHAHDAAAEPYLGYSGK